LEWRRIQAYDLAGNWVEDFSISALTASVTLLTIMTMVTSTVQLPVRLCMNGLHQQSTYRKRFYPETRHIAYDGDLDGGNGGFWLGAWADDFLVKMVGS
jgi:hypothetical protein